MVVCYYFRCVRVLEGILAHIDDIAVVTMFVFGIISIEVWPTQFPVWGFVLALVRRHITASDRLADSAVARRLLLHHSRRNDSSNHEQTDRIEVSLFLLNS